MTHDAWERGERLTVDNATKAQLKVMVKDMEAASARLYSENQELNKAIDTLTRCCGTAVSLLRETGLYEKYLEMLAKAKETTEC